MEFTSEANDSVLNPNLQVPGLVGTFIQSRDTNTDTKTLDLQKMLFQSPPVPPVPTGPPEVRWKHPQVLHVLRVLRVLHLSAPGKAQPLESWHGPCRAHRAQLAPSSKTSSDAVGEALNRRFTFEYVPPI